MNARNERKISRQYCTGKLRCDYAHVGLHDVEAGRLWIAKKRFGVSPIRVSHARLLSDGSSSTSTADKDRYQCYWFHTPGTGSGYVQGYPIEWNEGHLLIRLDPSWNYATRQLIPATDTAKIERNIEQQYQWGQKMFKTYLDLKPKFPFSWHMIGPRARDSMFYIERQERGY